MATNKETAKVAENKAATNKETAKVAENKAATNKETAKVFIVESPVKDFCGVGAAGIHFAYGKAEICEGWVLDWYKDHGYKVTEKAE